MADNRRLMTGRVLGSTHVSDLPGKIAVLEEAIAYILGITRDQDFAEKVSTLTSTTNGVVTINRPLMLENNVGASTGITHLRDSVRNPGDNASIVTEAAVRAALSVDHGSLTGLSDNDHPQYARTGATNTFTFGQTFSAGVTANALAVNGSVSCQTLSVGTPTGGSPPVSDIVASTDPDPWGTGSDSKLATHKAIKDLVGSGGITEAYANTKYVKLAGTNADISADNTFKGNNVFDCGSPTSKVFDVAGLLRLAPSVAAIATSQPVNAISTTITGASSNNQLVTALAAKNYADSVAGGGGAASTGHAYGAVQAKSGNGAVGMNVTVNSLCTNDPGVGYLFLGAVETGVYTFCATIMFNQQLGWDATRTRCVKLSIGGAEQIVGLASGICAVLSVTGTARLVAGVDGITLTAGWGMVDSYSVFSTGAGASVDIDGGTWSMTRVA